ncbi:MAG: DUF4129 domain-containing protein, partial [Chloroflexi bacterium]|nr:DUF4129 domain-containing protein [Chloroflexota bacterium]
RLSHGYGRLRFRLIELGLLFLLLQLCGDVVDGLPLLQAGLPRFDGKTLGLLIPVLLCWRAAWETSHDLRRLEDAPDARSAAVAPAERLARRFLAGGVVLFALAALSQVRIARALDVPAGPTSGPVLNVLLYFLLGLLMLGQVRYTVLQRRWRHQGSAVAEGLGGRWIRYTLAFLAILTFLALLLPTNRTVGLVEVGRALWGPVSAVAAQLVDLLRGLLSHLGLRANPSSYHNPPTLPPSLPTLPPVRRSGGAAAHPHAHGANPLLSIVQTVLFWAAILASAAYLIRSYLLGTQGGSSPAGSRIGRLLASLGALWGAVLAWLRGSLERAGIQLPERRDRDSGESNQAARLPRFLRVTHLPPRQQVLYYYLSIVRRAGRQGVPRRASQTPHEFEAVLTSRLSAARQDVHLLTEAFVEARYSPADVEPDRAGSVQASWKRVRAALRRLKK